MQYLVYRLFAHLLGLIFKIIASDILLVLCRLM